MEEAQKFNPFNVRVQHDLGRLKRTGTPHRTLLLQWLTLTISKKQNCRKGPQCDPAFCAVFNETTCSQPKNYRAELFVERMVRVSREEQYLRLPVLTVPHVGCFDFVSVLFGNGLRVGGNRAQVCAEHYRRPLER